LISQSCPRCGSYRIRRGYRVTRFWWKIFGRYNLLCNACNWEFVGFALPGTVDSHSSHRKRKKRSEPEKTESPENVVKDMDSSREINTQNDVNGNSKQVKVKKRVKVKLNK
jgi:hypothetical protein